MELFPIWIHSHRKRITDSFLQEANSISALKIWLKLPNVISYAIPSPHSQPQHTSHSRSRRNTLPCLKKGLSTVRGAGDQHGKHMSWVFWDCSLSNIRFPELWHNNNMQNAQFSMKKKGTQRNRKIQPNTGRKSNQKKPSLRKHKHWTYWTKTLNKLLGVKD